MFNSLAVSRSFFSFQAKPILTRTLMLASALILFGCAQPTDRGQQHLDGKFDTTLEHVDRIETDAPQDFNTFSAQAEKVEETSPSLKAKYQNLYAQLKVWAQESGDPSQLAKYGVDVEQLAGADKKGNILFTGYFSPVIEMRHTPDHLFKYPRLCETPMWFSMPNSRANL